ncbi:TIGR03943 family protein [Synechococcus sp. LA31]|uniref:TIGR03943 family putative permease subunit n=1 Tax=Synechococcus sp. LA31 TaxID=2741953 RepID=UPI001BDCB6F8|nr:TIGR03943 family protein [Synechococcus sp. LA31]QVV67788.1 TIGR03943 family protein [Synechococcus sp. LA31]
MGQSLAALIRPLALALWGAVLLVSTLSGRLDLLLRGVFHPLVGLSGVVLLAIALQQAWQRRRERRWNRSWALSSLLAIAVLALPPNPSFSDLASNRNSDLGSDVELDFLLPPGQRSLTDWVRLLRSQPDPQLYQGDPVRISGFVLTQPNGPPQLGRLLVRCCLADATPIGLSVRWPPGFTPKPDQWLAIEGAMGVDSVAGQQRNVVLPARIRPIPRPARPLEP